jgi:hypothetical protein
MKVEVSFDAVELHEATFSKAPECFNAVDTRFAFDQGSSFLDADMFVIAHINQPVVADPLIGVQYAGRINSAANDLLKRLLATIRNNLGIDSASPFVDAKDRLLTGGSALSSRTQMAF